MITANPKNEFVLDFDRDPIRRAVFSIVQKEPEKYILVNDDTVLHRIRLHEKGILLDVGYHIDFVLEIMSDSQTKVQIIVSRKIGAIDNQTEVHNSNYILKEITDKFSSYLSGKVDESGKAVIPKNDGCIGVLVLLILVSYFFLW